MLSLLKLIILLSLLHNDNQVILAREMLLRQVSKSNISTASPLIQTHGSSWASASGIMVSDHSYNMAGATTALPIPFKPNPEYAGNYKNVKNYQDIKLGICAIEDDYCSFQNNNGTFEKANATNLEDRCLLWDPSCSGNRSLAIQRFFSPGFQDDLLSNACFAQLNPINSVSIPECYKYNSLDRMSEFQEMRNWMRSQQCVSIATEWAAMTPGSSNFSNTNFTFASDKDDLTSSEDPDSQMAAKLDPHPYNYSSGVAPSCCGICDITAENVDIYYWPEPDANTSCLSIVGESVRPVDYGATTTEVPLESSTSTATYWGCITTGTYYNPISQPLEPAGNITYTYLTTTAQITTIGSLLVKVPLINPWSSSACLESSVTSQETNGSTVSGDKHAPMRARGHTLIVPSSITQKDGLPATTVMSGNFTFTSPSVYANFHGLKATDSCGGIIISSTMIAFAPGELATIDGPLGLNNEGLFATKSFDVGDLPCPPQSVMEANWYKPEPGEPYRPLIALPSRVKQIQPWLSYCTAYLFTAYDPPSALRAATALAPLIPPSDPKPHPLAPVPSPTVDPGAGQTVGAEASTPVPASIPTVNQPEATNTAAPVPPKQEVPNSEPHSNDPATQESSSSQPRPNIGEMNSDPQQNSNPQQGSSAEQDNYSKQASDLKQGSDPKQGSGTSGGSGQEADSDSNSDPNQGQAQTINNQVVQPLSHGISIAGTTLTPGAPPITVSGTSIHFGSTALVIGPSTVPLVSGDPSPITTTIGGHVITAAPDAIAVAGTTLTRGAPPITVSGTPIHFGSSALVVGTSTVPLAPVIPTQITTTIAGQAITAASNAVAIAGNILSPGAPGTTIDGTVLSLNTAGQFVVGSTTVPLGSQDPETMTTTIAGQAITAAPNAVAVAGTILTPGAPGTTLDGTLLSLNTASQLVVGSKTIPLEPASPDSITTTIDGQVITAAPNRIAIGGTALKPGASGVSVGGTLVSLNTAGQLIVGSKTIALPSGGTGLGGLVMGGLGVGAPSEVADPITTTIDGQVITAGPTALIMAGTTLTPGAPGFTIDGTVIALNTAAQLVVGSKTIPLESANPGTSGQTAGLGGLITGGFGSGGPFGPFGTRSPSPTQGNVSMGGEDGRSNGTKVFEGKGGNLQCSLSWNRAAVSVIAITVLFYMY